MYRTEFWTLWERVGWIGTMALKHVYYHVRNKSPVYVWYRIKDAWGWCPGMIQRDDMGWEVGGGFRTGNSCIHCHVWNRWLVASCCMAQGAQLGALWWPRWVGWGNGGVRERHMYTHSWFTLLYSRNSVRLYFWAVLNPPPISLPIPSLWVIPVHQPQACCSLHRT